MSEEVVATASAYTLTYRNLLGGVSPVPMLKRAAIMCDAICLDTMGLGEPGGDIERAWIQTAFGGHDEDISLPSDPRFRRLLRTLPEYGDAQQMDNATWEEAEYYQRHARTVVEGMSDDQLLPIASPWRGVDYKTRGALVNELSTDLGRPDALRPWVGNVVGLVTPLHTQVLGEAFAAEPLDPQRHLCELEREGVVDFGALSWREVLALRDSSFAGDFRGFISELATYQDDEISERLWRDLWGYVERKKPSAVRTFVGGVLGTLVGPLEIGHSAKQVRDAVVDKQEYGWLFFLLEANPSLPASPKLRDVVRPRAQGHDGSHLSDVSVLPSQSLKDGDPL